MLDEFLQWQTGPEISPEEELWFQIERAQTEGDDCVVQLGAREVYAPTRSRWLIRAHEVVESRLQLEEGSTLAELHEDHPLLIPHTSPGTELFVRDKPKDIARLLGDLWVAHRGVTGGWIRPDAYVHAECGPLRDDSPRGMGILAKGPRPVLEAYAEVARAHGMGPTLVGAWQPSTWRDGAWVPHPKPLYALVMDGSWLVAPRFTCERVEVREEA